MGFREKLQGLVNKTPDILGAALLGVDGIPIEMITKDPEANLELLGAEYAVIYKDLQHAANDFQSNMVQVMVKTSQRTLFLGGVTEEYFLLVPLARGKAGGRLRFLLKEFLPQLRSEM